jgi:hypothetical protein
MLGAMHALRPSLLPALFLASVALAQVDRAALNGTILDPQNAAISNAAVQVKQ